MFISVSFSPRRTWDRAVEVRLPSPHTHGRLSHPLAQADKHPPEGPGPLPGARHDLCRGGRLASWVAYVGPAGGEDGYQGCKASGEVVGHRQQGNSAGGVGGPAAMNVA